MKRSVPLLLLLGSWFCTAAQFKTDVEHALYKITIQNAEAEPVYKIKPAVDVPLTVVAAGWTIYGFSKVYSKDASTAHQIQNLSKDDVNGFDRWAAGLHSQKAADASDFFFNGSMPLPLVLLADKAIRRDAAKIGLLYLQAMSITGVLYTGATFLTDRYRPLTYSNEVPLDERMSGNARNSFFAGHVALVGTSTFFTAKVFSDYHPDSKLRYVFWGAAAVATGATGYLRHRAGKHFPSDVLIGTAVGTLSGILVPKFHKTKLIKNQNFTLLPFTGQSNGLAMVYRL
jgi:hypothetical protein